MRLIVAGLVLAAGTGAASAAEVRAARIWDSPEYTRAVFDLGGPVEYKLFMLADPARIVLDLKTSTLARDYVVPAGKGVVKALRSGRPTPNDLRIVIDLAATARAKSFLLPPAEGKGHRLVVDLYGRAAEMRQVVKSVASIVPPDERDVIVAIDAGHGGEDPGAIGATGKREKDITLATAKVLAEVIEAEPGMTAVLIRDGDYFVPLKRRYEKAREARADLFISIHADAFHKRSASGSSVFMLSQRGASSEAARWLADRENASDLVGGVSLDDKDGTLAAVLLDLSQGATLASSGAVAMHVLQGISGLGKVHKRDVQRANFVVLRSPDVPSILVETAFISNPAEEKRLTNPVEQRKLAVAILSGVRDYFHAAPPPGTWIAMHPQPPRRHIVARGESLSLIAQRHRVTLAALRSANKLRSDTVRVGDVLRIPTSS
jgi:N-acetylmuramoyl-L-alanine amidase